MLEWELRHVALTGLHGLPGWHIEIGKRCLLVVSLTTVHTLIELVSHGLIGISLRRLRRIVLARLTKYVIV